VQQLLQRVVEGPNEAACQGCRRHATTAYDYTSLRPGGRHVVLLKFSTNEDRHAALRGHKGLKRTKLGLDKDLTPTQQACKLELQPLFKEAKAASKHTF